MFLIFAPMATISHAGFRHLIENWTGCDLHFSEMIDAGAYLSQARFEHFYDDASPCPEKLIFQLVGSTQEQLVSATQLLLSKNFRGLDINMGCSAPHIVKTGAGIGWMSKPQEAQDLIKALRVLLPHKSLSAKFRLGETLDYPKLLDFALGLQEGGADFLTLHPRLKKQSYSRPGQWEIVEKLAQDIKIPLYGNGDILNFTQLKTHEQSYAKGFMIGRKAVQAPWIFYYWKNKLENPDFDFQINLPEQVQLFHTLLETYQPQEFWVTRTQRFYLYFSQNLKFGHTLGAQCRGIRDYEGLKNNMKNYWTSCPEEQLVWASSLDQ